MIARFGESRRLEIEVLNVLPDFISNLGMLTRTAASLSAATADNIWLSDKIRITAHRSPPWPPQFVFPVGFDTVFPRPASAMRVFASRRQNVSGEVEDPCN